MNASASTVTHAAERHPAIHLLRRYAVVFRAAWRARGELAGPARLADETAFLPAALSLQQTPVHPAPRRAAIAICLLFSIALAWSIFGKIDIVAIASGRIVVSERTKTIQPLETSVVSRVLVNDGDSVQAGQVLVELDSTAVKADMSSIVGQLDAADAEAARTTALIAALASARAPQGAELQMQAEWLDISARLAKFDAEHQRRQAEAATVQQSIAKLEATLPLARQREEDVKGLAEQGFMNQHAGQDRARERIELERDLAVLRARLVEAQATAAESRRSRASAYAETLRSLRERQSKANLERAQLAQARNKSEQRTRLTQLTAPVAGTIQQVAVHTSGGVVTPAQVLMVVVPKDAEVTAEVVLENKDIGFVSAGQGAEIKVETFPFTRYGTVRATVAKVSADAVTDEKRGAIFPATLRLDTTNLNVEGKPIALAPGMNLREGLQNPARAMRPSGA